MAEFKWITPDFAVAGQLSLEDIVRAGREGFRTLIKNRPEGEEAAQPRDADIRAAAAAAGLEFHAAPFSGRPPPGVVAEISALLDKAPGPVLAYCRTGTRSIMAWAMAQALAGARRPDELIAMAAKAGYDLAGTREALETLAPKS